MSKSGYVYIMASQRNGTLYVGVTSDLLRRVHQHKAGSVDGFTKKYGVKTLVYFEAFDDMEQAILREKAVKKWRRGWKVEAIERATPTGGTWPMRFLDSRFRGNDVMIEPFSSPSRKRGSSKQEFSAIAGMTRSKLRIRKDQ